MGILYTSGRWRVLEDRERDFITAWRQLGEWTAANIDGSTWAKLIQSRDDPREFLSFGPWQDEEAIAQWRADPGLPEARRGDPGTAGILPTRRPRPRRGSRALDAGPAIVAPLPQSA